MAAATVAGVERAPIFANHPAGTPTVTPETTIEPKTGGGDHDLFAHICRKDDVARAYVTGEAIEALCGKKWVPSRDPNNYPICPTCKEMMGKVESADQN